MIKFVSWFVLSLLLVFPVSAQDGFNSEDFDFSDDSEITEEPQRRAPGISRFTLTAERLHDESRKQVERMRKILAAHKRLLDDANRTGLVVAVEAIAKDFEAAKELYFLTQQLLDELAGDLSVNDPKSGQLRIDDPLMYPQVREIRILSDQAEQLFRAGRRFLAAMQKPTDLKVTRIGADNDEDL